MDDKIDTLVDFPVKGLNLNNYVQSKQLPHESYITENNCYFRIGDFDSKQIVTPGNKPYKGHKKKKKKKNIANMAND